MIDSGDCSTRHAAACVPAKYFASHFCDSARSSCVNPCPPLCCLIVNCAPVLPNKATRRSISEIVPIGSAVPAWIRISLPCKSGREKSGAVSPNLYSFRTDLLVYSFRTDLLVDEILNRSIADQAIIPWQLIVPDLTLTIKSSLF